MDDTSWDDDDQAGASVPCDDPKDADISAPRGDPNPKEAGRSTVDGCGALLNDPFPHDVAGSRLNDGNDPTYSDCPALPVPKAFGTLSKCAPEEAANCSVPAPHDALAAGNRLKFLMIIKDLF